MLTWRLPHSPERRALNTRILGLVAPVGAGAQAVDQQ